LFGYLQEIAGRTEQFWCPIKHARRIKSLHGRYQKFIDYGDAESYRARVDVTRFGIKTVLGSLNPAYKFNHTIPDRTELA
jgi:hypothetical protein